MESWVLSWQSRANAFCDVPCHLSKVLRLYRKKWGRVIRSVALVMQDHLEKSEDLMLQNATHLLADLWTCLTHICLLYCACHATCIFADPLQTYHACHRFCNWQKLTFGQVQNPLRLLRKKTLEQPKVVRTCSVVSSLTSTCASRQEGVHFLNSSSTKSGPTL